MLKVKASNDSISEEQACGDRESDLNSLLNMKQFEMVKSLGPLSY